MTIKEHFGTLGNDTLTGTELTTDVFFGSLGNDTYIVQDLEDSVQELAGMGLDTVKSSVNFLLGANLENLTLTGGAWQGTGNELNNVITGNSLLGNNLYGFAGNDVLTGGAGNDILKGDEGNDRLTGGAGSDHLNGGTGNDILNGGTGADQMVGEAGNDTYYVDDFYDIADELYGSGIDRIISSVGYSLGNGIENLTLTGNAIHGGGNELNNTIIGNSLAGSGLYGLWGNDVLTGGAGDDTLKGDEGNDRLTGGAGFDHLNGGTGNDILNGGAGQDYMNGGTGNDTYYVDELNEGVDEYDGDGIDKVISSVNYYLGIDIENLTLTGNATLGDGNELDNIIIGNSLINNHLYGNYGDDVLIGGAGHDELIGAEGDDQLTGGLGYDFLDGGNGDDTLNGGAGVDIMIGSAGSDTYYVDAIEEMVDEYLFNDAGIDTIISSVDYNLGYGIENLRLTGDAWRGFGNELNNVITGNSLTDNHLRGSAGNDVLTGGAGNDGLIGDEGKDRLTGGSGDDFLEGGSGNDTLNGGLGMDHMMGGTGNDTYYVNELGDIADEYFGDGIDRVISSIDYGLDYTMVENLTLTGNATQGHGNELDNSITGNSLTSNYLHGHGGDDMLTGGAAHDELMGNEGDDRLTGGLGVDFLDGGDGDDILNGGADGDYMVGGLGNDIYYVDDIYDMVSEYSENDLDTVISSIDYYLSYGIENMTLTGNAIHGAGNELDNSIYANLLNTVELYGYAGDDILTSGTGNDYLDGGEGDDRLTAGAGHDFLEGGAGLDTLSGGDGDDFIVGGKGQDALNGDAGNDQLFAYEGDSLTGGLGMDIFGGDLSDSTIRDFQKGTDLIRFEVNAFSPTHMGTFAFIGQQAFTGIDQLRFEKIGTTGFLYGNIDGDLAADFQVTLTGVTSIDITDLQLI
jgi:Ca2+-binding RTX toxin-like protein